MTREEAERKAALHPGAIVAPIVRDPRGNLVIAVPVDWKGGLQVLERDSGGEGEFVVLLPLELKDGEAT